MVRRDVSSALHLGLDIVDGVNGLSIQSDGLTCQRFGEDLHTCTQSQHEVQDRLFLGAAIGQSAAVITRPSSR